MKDPYHNSTQNQGLSLAAVIFIFLICFSGFAGSIAAVGYFYAWPKIEELRQKNASTITTGRTDMSSPDPMAEAVRAKKTAYLEAVKKTKELWDAQNYKEASLSAQTTLINANSKEEIAIAHSWIGLILVKNNKSKEAEAEFKKALENDPENVDAYSGLDGIYYKRKDYKNMLQNATRALDVNPNSSTFHNEKGVALYGLNRIKEAIAEYKQAIELNSGNTVAKENLKDAQAELQ